MPMLQRFDPLNPVDYLTGRWRNTGFKDFNQTAPTFVDPSVKYIRERKPILAGALMATTGWGAIPAYFHPQASPALGALSAASVAAIVKMLKSGDPRKAAIAAAIGGLYGAAAGTMAKSIYRRHNPELIEAQEKGTPYKIVK